MPTEGAQIMYTKTSAVIKDMLQIMPEVQWEVTIFIDLIGLNKTQFP